MLKVVIIDDEVLVRDIMVDVIDWKSYGVTIVGTAHDGKSAYELITREKPDIAIIDIRMPDICGLDIIEKIQTENNLSVSFIIISGYADFKYAQRAIALSVCAYLLKPISPLDVISAVQKSVCRIEALKKNTGALINNCHFAEPANEITTETDFDPLAIKYPFKIEQELLDALSIGDESQIKALLIDFSTSANQINEFQPMALNYCYMMLHMELCRFIADRGLKLPADSLGTEEDGDTTRSIKNMAGTIEQVALGISMQISKNKEVNIYVQNAMHYIDNHYKQPLTTGEIAEAIHLSPSYLSNLFKRTAGISVMDYVQNIRMKDAKELLINSHHKPHEVAIMVGYNDAKYFSQVFKKQYGISPSNFRKEANKKSHFW